MRVIFMGTPDFALPSLQALIDSSHEVVAVYTAPPRPAHRGKKVSKSVVHLLAERHNIPVYTPSSLKSAETQTEFKAHEALMVVVIAYGLLLPEAILLACSYGCINVHPSSLPRWRGAAPIQRTIMAGDRETSLCIMQMDAGLDTGAILMEESHIIDPASTAQELEDILAQKAAPLLLQTITALQQRTIFPMPQLHSGVTYASKITKQEALLDFTQPAHIILYHIHGLSPFPGACITYNNERIKILRAEAINTNNAHPAGTILDDKLTIQCGNHAIRPVTLQREGKVAMNAQDCLRGLSVHIGSHL